MPMETRVLDHSFACEVVGLRLWEPPDNQTIDQLRVLWAGHPVLVFRRQALSEDELADFSAGFGPLERIVRTDWASPVRPEVGVISNLKDGQGRPIGGLGDGELQWHSTPGCRLPRRLNSSPRSLFASSSRRAGSRYLIR